MDHGLPNPLSTCYINSFLQAMITTKAFRESCLSAGDPFGFMKLTKYENKTELNKHYLQMIKTLQKELPFMNILEFNDVHEFMIMCMDYMHEKSRGPLVLTEREPCKKNAYAQLKKMCDEKLEKHNSCFSHNFYSTMVLQTDCGNCKDVNLNIELMLSIDISNGLQTDAHNFDNLLKRHFRSMKVPDWKCEKCNNTHPDSLRYTYIWRPAEVLLVLVKRTRFMKGLPRKLTSEIEVPMKINLENYVLSQEDTCEYRLRGGSVHHGDILHGHYTALVFDGDTIKEYDDESITTVTSVDRKNIYMLVYDKL